MKYKTYEDLIAAYKSGELSEPLTVDNDDCFVYVDDKKVFQGNGPFDFIELAESVGIPCEMC